MKRKRSFLFLIVPFLLLAGGCKPECEEGEYASFTILPDSPPHGELVSYKESPLFDWHHNEACEPVAYWLTVTDLVSGQSVRVGRDSSKTERKLFDSEMILRANREYEWTVAAASMGAQTFGPESDPRRFRTDGLCQAHELVPPIPLTPPNGDWKKFGAGPDNARIEWRYPAECFPEFYHYQLAADPGFTNIITSGITEFSDYYSLYWPVEGEPWIRSPHYYQRITIPECARVYWRVEARRGNTSGGYSETFMFTNAADFGCWQNEASIDAALIKGFVFDDYCSSTVPYVPEGVGIFPPCVFGEPYGVHADGMRNRAAYEHEVTGEDIPAELGIPGVLVDLGAGPCPSTGLDQMLTMNNGGYYFMVQSPGEYCVSVNMNNNPALDHGIWTRPLTNERTTQYTITFGEGEDLKIEDFGWDQNDFLKIEFGVDLTSFCRAGDSKDHLAVAQVPAGLSIPIFARNEDATWFATFVAGKRCFISIASGEPTEDPFDLIVFPKQPDPVIPDLPPDPNPKTCSNYRTEDACMNNECEWVFGAFGPGSCKNP